MFIVIHTIMSVIPHRLLLPVYLFQFIDAMLLSTLASSGFSCSRSHSSTPYWLCSNSQESPSFGDSNLHRLTIPNFLIITASIILSLHIEQSILNHHLTPHSSSSSKTIYYALHLRPLHSMRISLLPHLTGDSISSSIPEPKSSRSKFNSINPSSPPSPPGPSLNP